MTQSADSKISPSKILNNFKKMEKGKKIWLLVLILLVISIIIALSIFLGQKSYTVLYSDMDSSETGEVLSLLSEMGVEAKSSGEDTILVPEEKVDEIRLELAAKGYPSTGVNDYGIYSSASGLGTTDSEKQVYWTYQHQANLRSTIMQMDKIENADVYIDPGEDSSFVFSDKEKPATASIMLTLKSGEMLSGQEVQAIRALVATTVSGLNEENVTIVDSQATLYTGDSEDGIQNADSQMALQISVQEQLRKQIVNLLGPVFGENNVLAEVNVKLNFDSKYTESVEYSTPAGSTEGIVVSMQELVEAITNNADGGASGATGLDSNGNASQYLESLDKDENAVYYDVSREVNYEINQTSTQIEDAQGEIESLSVSVILNESNIDDYVDEVIKLVAKATGADTENITVTMLPFTAAEEQKEDNAVAVAQLQEFEQQLVSTEQSAHTFRIVILAIAVLVVMIFIFAIVKMLIPKRVEMAGVGGIEVMIGDETELSEEPEEEHGIEIKDKDDNLSVLEEYIDKNPESAANLLRNWLNEE